MAITRLTDIVTVFDSKWTYGDTKFGYETEVNQDHDAVYPLMLIQPPSSIIPLIYDGREEYEFEINFYNLYSQSAQSVVTLQKRWDNLQDLANEWLDMVLKNYQDTTVDAFLNDESVEIERVKEVANDRLVQIKLTFTMSAFTKCFRPVSNYPSDYSDLIIWLKADSEVTFDIPTQRVSRWEDLSGTGNDVIQADDTKQPLRYGYDGADDKAYIDFDGTNDYMTSVTESNISEDCTIFVVGKADSATVEDAAIFGYNRASDGSSIILGSNGSTFRAKVIDAGEHEGVYNNGNSEDAYFIGRMSIDGDGIFKAEHNSTGETVSTIEDWQGTSFDNSTFEIGVFKDNYWVGKIEEVIVYNRVLESTEIEDIKNYLNDKYKIY